MIVVPSFAVSNQGYPPVISTVIVRFVVAVTPNVTGGVYRPGRVKHQSKPQEHAPNQHGHRQFHATKQITNCKYQSTEQEVRQQESLFQKL